MRRKIPTLIIEDEEPARALLKHYLQSFEEIELLGEYEDGFTGLKAINELQPELIFLDIQMPRLNGFEMLELLDELPQIIFTTAYDSYAIKAFELNAVDYLMKPFSKERLRDAIAKIIDRPSQPASDKENIAQLAVQMRAENTALERIVVKNGSKIHVIPVHEIEHIEAQDDYVMLHTATGHFMKKETMNALEKNLPKDSFLRVHRSHIINLHQLKQIEQYEKESYLLLLKNGSRIQLSRSRIKDLKRELNF